jgi:hypothetical protein
VATTIASTPIDTTPDRTPSQPRHPTPLLSEADLTAAVSEWFRQNVRADLWKGVYEECKFQLARAQAPAGPTTSASTLQELVETTRPEMAAEDVGFLYAELCFFARWLLGWVRVLLSDSGRTYTVIERGLGLALHGRPT